MVASYMDGMWQSFLLHLAWLPMGGKVYDNVLMYHSNSQLTSWVGVNGAVHVGKEDKQVKQRTLLYNLIPKIYANEGLTIPANTLPCNHSQCQFLSHTSCILHANCFISYLEVICVDSILLRQWGDELSDRTQKREGHGREREVRDGRRRIRRGQMGMVASYIDSMWQSFLLHLAWLPMGGKVYDNVHMYHSNSQLTRWVGVNGAVHVGKEDKQVKQRKL